MSPRVTRPARWPGGRPPPPAAGLTRPGGAWHPPPCGEAPLIVPAGITGPAPQLAGPASRPPGRAPSRRRAARRVCCGAAAAILGIASGLAAFAGMALGAVLCCAGPVVAGGAAAGSAAAGAAVSGWRLGLVWAVALMSGLAAFGLYRLAARSGPRPGRAACIRRAARR